VLLESNYDPALLRDGPYPWALKERILSPLGHLSNGDAGRYLSEGLGESCRHVILAHLSQKNNHPELARATAEEALAKGRRREVALTVALAAGTNWIEVCAQGRPPAPGPGQLPLF
jgi:phosphoribosyl 1,2-cyclic phosphodiesterase